MRARLAAKPVHDLLRITVKYHHLRHHLRHHHRRRRYRHANKKDKEREPTAAVVRVTTRK